VITTTLEEVERYYAEFLGDPLWEGEELAPEDAVYIKYYKPMPVSFGYEIEQEDVDIAEPLRELYVWHYDGSDPYETALPPALHPGRLIFSFLRFVHGHGITWKWKGEYYDTQYRRWRGCGSHVHFRVRAELSEFYHFPSIAEAWSVLYNTLIECVPILLPLTSSDTSKPLRREFGRWNHAAISRLSPSTIGRFLDPYWQGREYTYVTLNRHRDPKKPLTVEVRLNEAHPTLAYTFSIVLNRIVRRCFERGFWSPKLRDRHRVLREPLEYLSGQRGIGVEVNIYDYWREITVEVTRDYELVASILRESPALVRHPSARALRRMRGAVFFLARVNGEPAGVGCSHKIDWFLSNHKYFYVRPQFRRMGVYTELSHYAIRYSDEVQRTPIIIFTTVWRTVPVFRGAMRYRFRPVATFTSPVSGRRITVFIKNLRETPEVELLEEVSLEVV